MRNVDDIVIRDNYLEHLPKDRNAKILDIGCGRGRILKFLKLNGYQNFLGVDLDNRALQEVPEDLKKNTLYVPDLIDFLNKNSNSYDCIIAKDVIYYFPRHEIKKFMDPIASAIRPSGKIIVEIFNGAQLTAAFTAFKDIGIQTIYTEQSIAQALENANLKVTHLFGQKQNNIGIKKKILDRLYRLFIKCIYIAERGLDSNNPKIFTKSIIVIAEKKNQ